MKSVPTNKNSNKQITQRVNLIIISLMKKKSEVNPLILLPEKMKRKTQEQHFKK